MPVTVQSLITPRTTMIAPTRLKANQFSLSLYGDPAAEIDDLLPSIRQHGILVALVVVPSAEDTYFEVISGHRRLACALALKLEEIPCEVRRLPTGPQRSCAVLEYNRQRRKVFSQLMREADAIEELWAVNASRRRLRNLKVGSSKAGCSADSADCRNSDQHQFFDSDHEWRDTTVFPAGGRTDVAIAQHLELGGKDLYRQARKIWRLAQAGDIRAQSGIKQLDTRTKTIHAVYKDLRRRDRFSADFRPTPYDVWRFRHDRAFGIPHPGSIPPGIIAHTLHYFSPPGGFVVDPMAGGGTTIDVCLSMGRRCLAYDLHPSRQDILRHDIRNGFPTTAIGCDLIFCDPPYHTMLMQQYAR